MERNRIFLTKEKEFELKNNLIKGRIVDLTDTYKARQTSLPFVLSHDDLEKIENIAYQIHLAEIAALQKMIDGHNVKRILNAFLNLEDYARAEGIKRAMEWEAWMTQLIMGRREESLSQSR